jgi:arsenite/tail-anchored protein-transporting ATPase
VRTLLFTGPGGAGTTTLAASAAVRAARAGRRTVLLSRQTAPVAGLGAVPGLRVVRVDAQAALERLWGAVLGGVGNTIPQLTLPPASSVVPLPGTDELALFAELAWADAELVVVDAGPVDSASRLVALPATLRWWLDQAMPPAVRALAAVRGAALASGSAPRGPLDAALDAVPAVEALLAHDRLASAGGTAVCLVALPRRASAPALRSAATTLGLHGLRAAAVLARVGPADGADEWHARRGAEQDAALTALDELAPVHRVPENAVTPEDVEQLAALLQGFDPAPVPAVEPYADRRDGTWQLTIALPFAERGAVGLTRWLDDLVVTAGGARRCLRLDALLRRCEVTGGRLVDPVTPDARLEIGFRPDPQLWPAGLLAAEERTP